MELTNLSQKEYSPTTKPFNFQDVIKKQVERESWAIADIPTPKLPPYEKVKMKWTEVSKRAFASCITYFKI